MKNLFLLIVAVPLIGGLFLAPISLQPAAAAAPQYQGPPPPPPPGGYPPPPAWDRGWNSRPLPRAGACFFTDGGFRGDRFCMNRGENYPTLPPGFGNRISSIQTFGGAVVRIFNDSNYRNGDTVVQRSVVDLHHLKFRGGHTWNDRISSVIVY